MSAVKISIFTPSHDPTWLGDVYRSLCEQSVKDWEWIIVPNGRQIKNVENVANALKDDDSRAPGSSIVVVPFGTSDDRPNIGALKRFACEQASGNVYMELDHDDVLTTDCLESIVAAIGDPKKNTFLYSDDVTLEENGLSRPFRVSNGWTHYEWRHQGRDYLINKTFPITPRSLCEILYSPDHVRVWTKTAYILAGGHNTELRVGDDHELMVRTYLAKADFVHIPRPLYFHRVRGSNTSDAHVPEIQGISQRTKNRYFRELVIEWCRRRKLPMLDLGGAHSCPPQFIPVDMNPAVLENPAGIHGDILDTGLSYRDGSPILPNSIGCIRASDFLEHVPPARVPELMNRLYDLLVPNGYLLTHTPSTCDEEGRGGRGAFQDPTHVSFWNANSFWYYTRKEQAKYVPEIKCRFQDVVKYDWYPSQYHREHWISYITCDMMALKEEEPWAPGEKHI